MSELYFWNQWRKPYRIIYLILLVLFVLSILGLLYSVIWGNQLPFSWKVLNHYSPIELPLKSIDLFLSQISPKVEHYVLENTFQGSVIKLFPEVYAGVAIFSMLSISILVAIITAFPRFWYLLGMTLVALILVGLRLEQLMLFDSTENIGLYLALVFYLPLSFYFHSINKNIPLYNRIISFIGISLLFGIIIFTFSNVATPLLYIGTYGIVVPMGLSFIFILLVAHDIISGFLYLVTGGTTSNSKNSLLHFSLITLIYFGWLLITYLNNINYLHWDVIYINPAALLIISAIVGVFGFRERCGLAYTFLPFHPFGAILYLSLGIICLITLGSFYLTANDPMLGMFEDFIIFSHMGVGLMFFIYIIANFAGILQKNLNVFRIQYKPLNLPYFITNVGGIILMGVLVAKSLMYPYYQGLAGYYNGLGDLFAIDKQLFLSEQYYKLARSYDVSNHRSNYSLASLAMKQGDEAVALKYFDDALTRLPSAQAFVNIANIYKEKGRFFDALFILNEGLQKFPENPYIQNNLANLFGKTSLVDSARYYLGKARTAKETQEAAEINLLKLYIANGINLDTDSLLQNLDNNLKILDNTLAYFNFKKAAFPTLDQIDLQVEQQGISSEAFTFWHEYTLNQLMNRSGQPLDSILSGMASDSTNLRFQSELLFLAGLSQYYGNRVGKSFETFKTLQMTASSRSGYYSYLMGLLALEQRAYHLAEDLFRTAIDEGHQVAYPMAFALTAIGNKDEAILFWEKVLKEGDNISGNSAAIVKRWMSDSVNLNDSTAFIDVLFNRSSKVPELLEQASAIGNSTIQINAWLVILEKALEADKLTGVNSLIELLKRKELNETQTDKFNRLCFEYWVVSDQINQIQNFIKDSTMLQAFFGTAEFMLFKAKQAEAGGNTEDAKNYYTQLATLNPFFEAGIIDAAHFFNSTLKDKEEAYQIILEALRLNPYAVPLQKAYILQSLELHLTSYAENNLQNLKKRVNTSDFEAFLDLYDQKKDSLEQVQSQWE